MYNINKIILQLDILLSWDYQNCGAHLFIYSDVFQNALKWSSMYLQSGGQIKLCFTGSRYKLQRVICILKETAAASTKQTKNRPKRHKERIHLIANR